jgi:Right handed beta helix region
VEIRDNTISNVRIGIMMTYSDGFAPQRCHAHHNFMRAGTAQPQTGAEIVGLSGQKAEDCSIEFNSIDGFGTTGGIDGGSVRVQYALRPRVVSNRITNSLQSALVLFGSVEDAEVTGNTILGIDSRVGAYIAAIKVPDGTVTGRITDNHIEAGIAAGIRVHAKQRILVDRNFIATTGRRYHPDLSYFLTR